MSRPLGLLCMLLTYSPRGNLQGWRGKGLKWMPLITSRRSVWEMLSVFVYICDQFGSDVTSHNTTCREARKNDFLNNYFSQRRLQDHSTVLKSFAREMKSLYRNTPAHRQHAWSTEALIRARKRARTSTCQEVSYPPKLFSFGLHRIIGCRFSSKASHSRDRTLT